MVASCHSGQFRSEFPQPPVFGKEPARSGDVEALATLLKPSVDFPLGIFCAFCRGISDWYSVRSSSGENSVWGTGMGMEEEQEEGGKAKAVPEEETKRVGILRRRRGCREKGPVEGGVFVTDLLLEVQGKTTKRFT